MEKRSVTRYRVRRRGHTSPDDERLEEPIHCPEKLFCSSSTPPPPAGLRPGGHGLPPACSPPLTPHSCLRRTAFGWQRWRSCRTARRWRVLGRWRMESRAGPAACAGGAASRTRRATRYAASSPRRRPGRPDGRMTLRARVTAQGWVGSEGSSFPRMKSPAGSAAAIPVSHDALFGAGSRAVRPYLSCPN